MYADLAVIQQAAGGNSANHHGLQHGALGGQAARRAEVRVSLRVCSCMYALLCLLQITLQAPMLKIPHIPEKYSLFPYIHQGIKTESTFPLPCLPNQGNIVLLNWTQSSGGTVALLLGCCAELSHCLSASTQLLMLYLYHISVFLNKF